MCGQSPVSIPVAGRHDHSDRPSTSHRRRAAALRHAIRPAVRLRLAVGRAGLLPDRPRTERAANRTVADADTRRRHHRLALPHDSRRPDWAAAHAGAGSRTDGCGRARVRIDPHALDPRDGRDGGRHQPERSGSWTVSVDRAGRALTRGHRPEPDRGIRVVHVDRIAGHGVWRRWPVIAWW